MTVENSNAHSNINFSIGESGGHDHLMIRVGSGAACVLHRITLDQARALSLAIIKQVNRLESVQRLSGKLTDEASVQAFSFR